ncbi:39S ribosomal protein L34, mitochondrial [Lemmus lemmus]
MAFLARTFGCPPLQIGSPVGWQVAPTPGLDGAPGRLGAPLRAAADPRCTRGNECQPSNIKHKYKHGWIRPGEHPDRRASYPPLQAEGPQVPEPLRKQRPEPGGIDSDASRTGRGQEVGGCPFLGFWSMKNSELAEPLDPHAPPPQPTAVAPPPALSRQFLSMFLKASL